MLLVASVIPTLWDPMDCSPPGSSVHGILWQECWGGLPFPSSEALPDPGIKPWSPPLQADSLLILNVSEIKIWISFFFAISKSCFGYLQILFFPKFFFVCSIAQLSNNLRSLKKMFLNCYLMVTLQIGLVGSIWKRINPRKLGDI